jgi:hypothetical protein
MKNSLKTKQLRISQDVEVQLVLDGENLLGIGVAGNVLQAQPWSVYAIG